MRKSQQDVLSLSGECIREFPAQLRRCLNETSEPLGLSRAKYRETNLQRPRCQQDDHEALTKVSKPVILCISLA